MDKTSGLILNFFIILILLFLQPLLGPYGIIIMALGLGVLIDHWKLALGAGFFIPFCLWALLAINRDLKSNFLLSQNIAQLFSLPYSWMSYLVSGTVAGGVGGILSLSVFFLKKSVIISNKWGRSR